MKSNDINPSLHSRIYTEQVAHLYNHAPLSFVFTIINGSILAFLQHPLISNLILFTWFSTLILVTLIRSILVYAYHQDKFYETSINYWHWSYLAGTAFAGCVWGSAAIFLFPADAIEHQLFVVFVLAGMNTAAVPVLAASMAAFFMFALPTILPLATQMFLHGSALFDTMAIMLLFYLLGLSIAARGMNKTILSSLTLRFDNSLLVKEIVERQTVEDALFQQKERLQITFTAMAEGLIITDPDGVIEYLNPAAETISGWSNLDAIGKSAEQVFNHFIDSIGEPCQSAIYECLKKTDKSIKNTTLISKGGDQRIIEEVVTPLKDRHGNLIGTVGIFRDITQESEQKRKLSHQATHDALTGLPNRILLCDRLEHAISKAIRANTLVAVLFIDLDRFKQINDSLGHAAGDTLLQNVAERLTVSARQEDTVARLGGDEFVVILEDIVNKDQAMTVAQKIVKSVANPLSIKGHEISVKVSIGITIYPQNGKNGETLLKNADLAMYRTKKLGQDKIQFYTGEMSARALSRLKLEQQLEQAVARDELELYYQPRININSGKIVGFEALVRWRTSSNTLILPAEFIHIAEETGSILVIGEWVLYTACRQAQSWRENGQINLHIAVNLSVSQILNANITELIAKVLRDTGLPPEFLELEITESIFLKDAEHAIIKLQELKAMGIKLAIDDFGTGYSSLTYIKRFPIDILKIDKSFISDISGESVAEAIIPAIITMGHGLNLEVIAEGVEQEIQLKYLRALGCDSFQGYYFSQPLPEKAVNNLLYKKKP